MNAFHEFAVRWFAWMVAASWQLALLVCLVAIISVALRGASPRLRHGLWLLVLLKVFLPPHLTAPWSLGRLAVAPVAGLMGVPASELAGPLPSAMQGNLTDGQPSSTPPRERPFDPSAALLAVWAGGCLVFWGAVVWRYVRLARAIRSGPAIDEGPVRIALERIALDLGLRHVPDLYATDLVTSPFLFGLFRPAIVLPCKLLHELSEMELRAVLTHELVHVQRFDTWVGWLQVLAQGVFWFHPFVWWANGQLRQARECACDENVLRLSPIEPQPYGESILRVLTASRGRSLAGGSLIGVFERGVQLQERLENIMNYKPRRHFDWGSRLTLAAAALVLLPMSPGDAQTAAADRAQPRIVKTSPQVGATDVAPGLQEITVTFDLDMAEGMSWTGGPPEFPPLDESRKPRWKDARTCGLPVKLEPGTYYRVGINSKSHQNFQSKSGVPARPTAIYFTTQGASEKVQALARIPEVISLEPENGAADVDPKTAQLRVTFNMPMGEGMSWTGGGPKFPEIPEGKKPSWSKDRLNCTLPVALKPEHDYELGLNSASHKNFQSASGVPLKPVAYRFRTAAAK